MLALTGCVGGIVEKPKFDESVVIKVSVLASGTVLADGTAVSLQDLDARLAEIKKGNGVVQYYRENATGTAPAAAKQVMDMVIAHKLPIGMSTKSDFSDWVDQNGVSHPRQ